MRAVFQHYAHPLHIACRVLALAQALRIHADLRAILAHPAVRLYERAFKALAYARPA